MAIRLLNTTPQRVSWLLWAQPGPACRAEDAASVLSAPRASTRRADGAVSHAHGVLGAAGDPYPVTTPAPSELTCVPGPQCSAACDGDRPRGLRWRDPGRVEPACASARPSGNREIPLAISIWWRRIIHSCCLRKRSGRKNPESLKCWTPWPAGSAQSPAARFHPTSVRQRWPTAPRLLAIRFRATPPSATSRARRSRGACGQEKPRPSPSSSRSTGPPGCTTTSASSSTACC